ncbi:RagB/SusD family nutrient uptake outer membrane protein [Fodinibius roseus]|nr:RagB/SusD family nutrient uptake outer membrane protein [Fodinibius roseus]
MKQSTCYLLLLGFIVLVVSGCGDFLSQSDPTSFTDQNYYTQPAHAEAAVNAIYEDLRAVRGGGFGGAPWLMTEFQTGLANTELGQATNSLDIRALDNSADNGYGQTYWNSHYRGIANANEALANIPDIPQMDGVNQNRLLGEARFLRAYYYYNLVRLFGDVPLILEPVGLNSELLEPERTSAAEVYDAIVEDLMWVEQNSGLTFNDESGRVTMGAVKTLLSSVYLTMAGYPLEGGEQYYQLARDKASEVMDSGEYHLFDNYADLHSYDTENSGEHIFMVQFNREIIDHNGLQYVTLPYNQDISLFSAETGGIFAQEEFVDSYEQGDKRTEEKQFYYREFSKVSDRETPINLGGWYLYKFFDQEANTATAVSGLNWPLFRYAEVLLIYAEAENEVSGPTLSAHEAVNKIRRRAEVPELSGLSQADFREAVWKEKWHELSYENKTWFDMVRLRRAYNVETGEFENYVGHTFVYGPTLSERELLFPIPATERRNNENLTQNPGY